MTKFLAGCIYYVASHRKFRQGPHVLVLSVSFWSFPHIALGLARNDVYTPEWVSSSQQVHPGQTCDRLNLITLYTHSRYNASSLSPSIRSPLEVCLLIRTAHQLWWSLQRFSVWIVSMSRIVSSLLSPPGSVSLTPLRPYYKLPRSSQRFLAKFAYDDLCLCLFFCKDLFGWRYYMLGSSY